MATLSIILAWGLSWTDEPWRIIVHGSQKGGRNSVIKQHITPTFKLTFWLQSQDFNKWCIQAFSAQGC